MARCDFCGYFFPGETMPERAAGVCAVCAARTTREVRLAVQRGQRTNLSYMDSD